MGECRLFQPSKFQEVRDTPWKLWNKILSWLIHPYIRLLFAWNSIPWGHGWRFYGVPIIQKHRTSIMNFGQGFNLRSSVRSSSLGPTHPVILCTWQAGSVIEIGTNFGMTGGSICASERITIGNNVVIGANCTIIDSDFHPLDPEIRRLQPKKAKTAPIVIQDDVFIGMHCLILKGVTIGSGSVIGAGSVVARDVPPNTIAAGNPVQVIKQIEQKKT